MYKQWAEIINKFDFEIEALETTLTLNCKMCTSLDPQNII